MERSTSQLLAVLIVGCFVVLTYATNPTEPVPPTRKPPVLPPTTGHQTCPVPSEEMLRCMRQWACQYIIRLDLRCLLNLNGNPLLGGVLGRPGGSSGGGGGSILGGILG